METTVKGVLVRARDLLSVSGWCKGKLAADVAGFGLPSDSEDAVSFCAVGAIYREVHDQCASGLAVTLLDRLSGGDVVAFNNAPERTKEEVLDLFDRAIAAA